MWTLCAPSPPASLTLLAAPRERAVGLERAGLERLLEPERAGFLQRRQRAAAAASTSSMKICPTSTSRMPSGPSPSRAAMKLVAIRPRRCRGRSGPSRTCRRESRSPRETLRALQRLLRRVAEQHRGVGQLRDATRRSRAAPDRLAAHPPEQIPQRDLDAREGVGGLQQVHAVVLDRSRRCGRCRPVRRASARAPRRRRAGRRRATSGRRRRRWRQAARPRIRPSRRARRRRRRAPAAHPGCRPPRR